MDVKEFLKTTLLEISEAIDDANDEFGSTRRFQLSDPQGKIVGLVEFDLAVEAKQTGSRKKGAGVKVAVLEASLGDEKNYSSSSVSRIKFVVMDNH